MIRFQDEPNRERDAIVSYVLLELLKTEDEDLLESQRGSLAASVKGMLTPQQVLEGLENVYKAHISDEEYMLTDQLWLLLDRTLRYCLGKEEADEFIERYFWDADYDLSPDLVNRLSSDDKKHTGMGDGVFGAVNRLLAHPDELKPFVVGGRTDEQ